MENIAVSSRSVIAAKFTQPKENTCSQLPRLSVLSKTIQRCRLENSGFPANPGTKTVFEIPEEYCKPDNGEQFLRYDSGIEYRQRISILASESALQDMTSYPRRACDGTFKIVPEQRFQLFSIHVQVKGSSFPWVFALLPNKTKQTYELVFEQLKIMQPNEIETMQPLDLMANFEVAVHKAFISSFPNSSIGNVCFI
ncbi:Hypothetical predicted protein [Octopus vulgaris]|uniref:MULE transposase domain-containing protein n=1 Tax=Octopus vulgaris TaxID=6645 RepID=A0AA36BSB0_OCTVU|nr:Hypothetical predicted protein [Octopus vulgaris]